MCLDFSENVVFEPQSSDNQIFFDPLYRNLITVRLRGILGVNVKCLETSNNFSFKLNDINFIINMKINSSLGMLIIQQTRSSLDFQPLKDFSPLGSVKRLSFDYEIQNFLWMDENAILVLFHDSFEVVFNDQIGRGPLKKLEFPLKGITSHYFCPEFRIFVVFYQKKMETFKYQSSSCSLISISTETLASDFLARDILLIYNRLYFCSLKRNNRTEDPKFSSYPLCIELARIKSRKGSKVSNYLLLPIEGNQVNFNVVDNLVYVHILDAKKSFFYDLGIFFYTDGQVKYHVNVLPPIEFPLISMDKKFIPNLSSISQDHLTFDLYDSCRSLILPHYLIDKESGILWIMNLDYSLIKDSFDSEIQEIKFLSRRSNCHCRLAEKLSVISNQIVTNLREDFTTNEDECFAKLDSILKLTLTNQHKLTLINSPLGQEDLDQIIFQTILENIHSHGGEHETALYNFLLSVLLSWLSNLFKAHVKPINRLRMRLIELYSNLRLDNSIIFLTQSKLFTEIDEFDSQVFAKINQQICLDIASRNEANRFDEIVQCLLKEKEISSLLMVCGEHPELLIKNDFKLLRDVSLVIADNPPLHQHTFRKQILFILTQYNINDKRIDNLESLLSDLKLR